MFIMFHLYVRLNVHYDLNTSTLVDAEREERQPDLGRRPVLHEESDGDLYLISIIFMIITFTMTIIITKVTESAKKKEEFYWDEKEVTEEAPATTGRRSISGIRF